MLENTLCTINFICRILSRLELQKAEDLQTDFYKKIQVWQPSSSKQFVTPVTAQTDKSQRQAY